MFTSNLGNHSILSILTAVFVSILDEFSLLIFFTSLQMLVIRV